MTLNEMVQRLSAELPAMAHAPAWAVSSVQPTSA